MFRAAGIYLQRLFLFLVVGRIPEIEIEVITTHLVSGFVPAAGHSRGRRRIAVPRSRSLRRGTTRSGTQGRRLARKLVRGALHGQDVSHAPGEERSQTGNA